MMFSGIDIGSLATKALIIRDKKVISYCILKTGIDHRKAGERALNEALSKVNSKREELNSIVATGYGRVSLPFADKTVTELTCHARGAYHINPEIRTVIDIGGQDSKVIRLNEEGKMSDFVMNDKCAAGTGRFLEVMAQALGIKLAKMGELSLQSKTPCYINNTCTVFAESEVISLLASGKKLEDIIAGLHTATGMRVGNMVKNLGIKKEVVFVGGVAKNIGVRRALEKFLEVEFINIDEDLQTIGSLGAALIGRESYKN